MANGPRQTKIRIVDGVVHYFGKLTVEFSEVGAIRTDFNGNSRAGPPQSGGKKKFDHLTPSEALKKSLKVSKSVLSCNLRGHLQRCQMPDIENSRKTAEKGAEWVTVKQPKNSRKNSRNTRKTAKKQSKQLFFGCFRCFSGCFSAVLP